MPEVIYASSPYKNTLNLFLTQALWPEVYLSRMLVITKEVSL